MTYSGSIDSGHSVMTRRSDEESDAHGFCRARPRDCNLCHAALGDRELAEDAVQEALIRIWRHPEVLTNGRGSVRRLVADRRAQHRRQPVRARAARPREIPESADRPAAVTTTPGAVAASVTVHAALDAISPEHRTVIEEVYLQGRDLDEVAAMLGVPKGTVKSRAHYALRALRKAMQSEDTGSGNAVIEHDPDELGAYVLGMLDAEEAALVEAHLRDCGSCRADLAELKVATDALDEVPIETFVHGPPDGDQALRRAIGQLRGPNRRLTGLRVAAVVALVLLALAVGILVGRSSATAPVPTTGPTARPGASRSGPGHRAYATTSPNAVIGVSSKWSRAAPRARGRGRAVGTGRGPS